MSKIKETKEYIKFEQQTLAIDALYDELVTKNQKNIFFISESGLGSTTCISALLDRLCEGWSFFVIEGAPLAIIDYANFNIKKSKRISFSPEFGLCLGVIQLNMGLSFSETDCLFNDLQKLFLQQVLKSNEEYSLIIVDGYNKLSRDVQLYINTIMYLTKNKPKIHFLVAGEEIDKQLLEIDDNSTVYLKAPKNDDNFKKFAVDSCENKTIDIDKIYKLTKGNLSFAKKLLTDCSSTNLILDDIILSRISKCLSADENLMNIANDILTLGSFFKQGFTQQQVWDIFEHNHKADHLNKVFYKFHKLDLLDRHDGDIYKFSLNEFKEYFRNGGQGQDLREFYYKTLYDYFTRKYDYDYEVRAYYLDEYLEHTKCVDEQFVSLFFLMVNEMIYSRKIKSIKQIKNLSLFRKLLKQLPTELMNLFEIIIDSQSNATVLKFESYLQSLNNLVFENIIIDSEIIRLKIEFLSKITRSTAKVENTSKVLLNFLPKITNSRPYFEYAHWIRISSTLISHITNRANLQNEFDNLIIKYSKVLDYYKSTNFEFSQFYRNLLNKKAVLYAFPDIACQKITNATTYFNKRNPYEYYKCIINLLGTQIVLGRNSDAAFTLEKIKIFIKSNPGITFPQIRKLESNKLLLMYINGVNKDISKSYKELATQYPESNIIEMNYISILLSSGVKEGFNRLNALIRKNAIEFNEDNFYKYFLNDLKLAYEICINDYKNANKTLDYLRTVELPRFYGEDYYCKKRLEAFEIILSERQSFDFAAFKNGIYDVMAKRNYFGKDEAWKFFARGFILSDYQFFI
ncbi:MAG: hypothetical protein FWE13_02750 [Firmicutes bacterium]|nr:hypothetical protein [Bacillota bacterium]